MRSPHFLLAVAGSVILASCSGSESTASVECAFTYWNGTVGTCLPDGWIALDRDILDARGAPPEVVVAFQAEQPISGLFPTVSVTRELLAQAMESEEYSDASLAAVKSLPGYEAVNTSSLTVDGAEVDVHTFTSQVRTNDPKTRFSQVSISDGQTGYTFTAASPISVGAQTEEEMLLILQNATLMPPEGGSDEG